MTGYSSNQPELEHYVASEILRLNFKNVILKNASQKFTISKEQALEIYNKVKPELKAKARNRAWIYTFIGGIFLGVGLFGTLSKTGFIFIGALLGGISMLLTAIGYFRIALTKSHTI